MSRLQQTRTALCLAIVAAGLATNVAAETTRRARKSQPVPTYRAAPDTTGTIATAKAPPTTNAADDVLPQPFNLPAAPRARVRACGESWQAKKLAGDAGDDTWREYATKCLADSGDHQAMTTNTVGTKANQTTAGP